MVSSGAALFPSTTWGTILAAKDKCPQALAALCTTYRECLLVYLRAARYEPHDAEDLVQGFFACLWRRNFLEAVAPENGRFRTFLLKSLKHHLRDEAQRQWAIKRGSGQVPLSLEQTTEDGRPRIQVSDGSPGPDEQYDRAWADTVLHRAFARLEDECVRGGRLGLFTAIVSVLREEPAAESYREVGERLGMSEGAVKVAAKRLRDRLGYWIREEIRETVSQEEDLEPELTYFVSLFGNCRWNKAVGAMSPPPPGTV